MNYSKSARTTTRRIPWVLFAVLLIVIAALAVTLDYLMLASSSSTPTSPTIVLGVQELPVRQSADDHARRQAEQEARQRTEGGQETHLGQPRVERQHDRERQDQTPDPQAERGNESSHPRVARLQQIPHEPELAQNGAAPGMSSERPGTLGQVGGAVGEGVTVFDDEIPSVANLDPALLGALRLAATDAADDGVEFFVNSGWRSPEYQEQLFREAVSTYGSEKEAARWVASPTTSAHVSGDAVDIGPVEAAAWLSEHGAKYGLCQIYSNEPWHYELRPEAIDHGCPPMYADPTHDPRMQQ